MPSYKGYRPDRKEERLAIEKETRKRASERRRLEKKANFKIRDSKDYPLDNRI